MNQVPSQAPSGRRKRFQRERARRPGFVFQERDRLILDAVWRHRFLDSRHIARLVAGSHQNILRRLQKLYHHGHLDRPPEQRVLQGHPIIYALGKRGAEVLAEATGKKLTAQDWSEKNRTVTAPHLQHALMVSEFLTALQAAIAGMDLKMPRLELAGPALRFVGLAPSRQGEFERVPIAPDAFFVLQDPEGRIPYLLECDRGTIPAQRYLRKLQAYFYWWQTGGHTRALGIKQFRILTLTRTTEREESLRKIAIKANARQTGWRGFWFGSMEDFKPETPTTVLKPFWKVPGEESTYSLLD